VGDALEARIRERLLPLDAYDPVARRIHSDLSRPPSDWLAPEGPLQPAAVLVPLVERPEGLSVILTLRAASLRRHSGQIAFPGGRAEPGEAPWEAALREAQEEIALDPGFVRVAGLGDTYDTVTGYAITPVVGFVREGFRLSPQEAEVAEIFEEPFSFLMDPLNHERRSRDFGDGRVRRYFAIPHEDRPHDDRLIWGVTAGIVRMLYERLYG